MIVIRIVQKVCTSSISNRYCWLFIHLALSTGAISGTNRPGILWTFISPRRSVYRIRRSFHFFSKIEFEYWNIHQSRWNSCKNLIFNHKCDQLSNPFSHKTLFRDQCFGYLGLHTILQEICVQIFFILSFDRIRGSHFLVKIQIMRWFPITSFPITYRARYLNYVLAKLAEKMNHSWKIWNPLKTTSVTLNSIVTVRKRSGKSMLTSKISQTEFYGS